MPAKGKEEPPKKVLLGRPGNNVKMGCIGMPNVGKSSLFNTLSKLNIPAENFPFCTIDPNVARIPVPDARFKKLCEMYKPKSEVGAMLTITDIAGLVRGASEGAGLGNAFLSHIKAVDGLYHVLRAFENKDVTHVEESVNPIRDMNIIHDELRLKDVEQCKTYIAGKKNFAEKKALKKDELFFYETIVKVLAFIEGDDGKDVRAGEWDGKEIEVLNNMQFLTAKPMIYLVNVSEKSYKAKGNKWLEKIGEAVAARGNGDLIIPFSVIFEQKVVDEEVSGGLAAKQAFMKKEGARSVLPKIIKTGYSALNMINYFTAGPDEVRAWCIKKDLLAPQAAGVIHTDFEKKFVSVDVFTYDDLVEHGSEAAVKAAGKVMQKGKTYEVQDGDILFFKHGR